jgi:hypothetical protein
MIKHLMAIPTLLFAAHASAGCPTSFPAEQPIVPDGKSASEAEMYRAQVAVKAYVDTIETLLECRTGLIPLQQNRGVFLAEQVANDYNEALQEYREKASLAAAN